ncbi:MAG: hypothetical protein IJ300_09805, partial [Clostridia bacterium]|nr:hypothetical protein [Clostridia bacterium]
MDRIIDVKVGGNYLSKDNKNAGVRGEANVTQLRITFDEGWDGYAKKVTFWDARGANPVERTLTTDLIENIAEDTRVYLVPIPAEPMVEAGMLTFVIDGYIDGKRQRSIADKLEVKDAPVADDAGEPAAPTPTQAEQLQVQIDGVMNDLAVAYDAKISAEASEAATKAYKEEAAKSAEEATLQASIATESCSDAGYYARKVEAAIGKSSYIGENGNWYAWNDVIGAFYDTGVKAQSGSTVYIGDNPPDDADVWINPEGGISYANHDEAGVVKVSTDEYSDLGVYIDANDEYRLRMVHASLSDIQSKKKYRKPITPRYMDYAMSQGTHQTMADDYDVTAMSTGYEMIGNQGQLPASYDAVKRYADTQLSAKADIGHSHSASDVGAYSTKEINDITANLVSRDELAGDYYTALTTETVIEMRIETKADKATIETSEDTSYTFEFANTHNTEKRLAEVTSISFTFGDGEYNA